MKSQDRDLMQKFGRYLPLATALPVCTFVGYAIGYYLDKWLGTTFFYIVFLLLGIAAGLLQVVREATKDKS